MNIKRADVADVDAVVDTLSAAFEGYPWTDWALPQSDHQVRLRATFRTYTELAVRFLGEVWMTGDASSVAAWLAPHPSPIPEELAARVASELRLLAGDMAERVAALEHRLADLRPAEPHWFLATMATRLEARGRGLATKVLTPVLQRCDADGVVAALETSAVSNVGFYRRLGFEVVGCLETEEGAPPVWAMHRFPSARA